MIIANSVVDDILSGLIAAMGLLDGADLELLQGAVPSNPAAVLGDFTVADFSGYGAATIAAADWVGPSVSAQGSTYVLTDDQIFTAADPLVVPNTLTGWLLHDGVNPIAWGAVDAVVVDRPGQIVRANAAVAAGASAENIGQVESA
jgi:hypothetical protein